MVLKTPVAQRRRAVITWLFVAVMMAVSAGFASWLNSHYRSICPTEPDASAGLIYPMRSRGSGKTVYLNLDQHRRDQVANFFGVFTILAGAGVLIMTRSNTGSSEQR
jgi:hypothetical protein